MKKNECGHTKSTKEKQLKEFQGEKFHFEAQTCNECGAVLWNNEIEKKYNLWLEKLQSKKRHLFQVQYFLTEEAISCIQKLNERFPGVDDSLLIRAMVMVYLDIVEDNEKIMKIVDKYIDTPDYHRLTDGKKKAKKLQFKPNGIKDVLALADMFKVKPNKIIEEAVYRVLMVSIKEDSVMRDFWEKVVLKNIETILKAAQVCREAYLLGI